MEKLIEKFNIVFLDTDTFAEAFTISELEKRGNTTTYPTTTKELTFERCKDAHIVITNKVVLDAEIINQCTKLKLICVAATGTNNVDTAFAQQKNILVKNIVNYSTNSVAQITLGLVLQLLNQIQYHDRYVKNGFYTQSNIFTHLAKPFSEIHNKRWGILGLGNIGKKVAEIAQAFGAEVVYHSISGEERKEIYQNISLEELLKTSDIISIHSPLNNKSKHLIGWKELNMMKKSAILVNTGRGGIVNEKDLAQALNENTIAGAGIDVYEQEPIPINNPLLSIKYMDKLVLSPHIAWASKEARSLALSKIYQHIDTFIQSKQ